MGRNNRRRRAAKARARARQRTATPSSRSHGAQQGRGDRAGPRTPPTVASLFAAAAYAAGDDPDSAGRLLDRLAVQPVPDVATCVADALGQYVVTAWDRGWQPTDLDRFVRRTLGKVELALVRQAVAVDAGGYAAIGDRVAPAWMAQVAQIRPASADPRVSYLLQVGGTWTDVLAAAARLGALLLRLPPLPRLTEPPSAWHQGLRVVPGTVPSGVLEKVRALLAKAETTTFDAEAEAFTAKAQELMARHRIDQAVVAADDCGAAAEPIGRRIGVDDPYADAKSFLLGGISRANGCRAVWSRAFGFATVFGHPDELAAVEELFTSLLVQATAALRREGSKRDAQGRSRTTRFRRSFLVAFAARVSERLGEAVAATVRQASADTGTALVPVLAAREEATEAAVRAAFPELDSFAPAASDAEGWYAGTLAGEQASLARGPELSTDRS